MLFLSLCQLLKKLEEIFMLGIVVTAVCVILIALWAFLILRSLFRQWRKIRTGEASSAGCYSCSAFKNGMCSHSCGKSGKNRKTEAEK